MTKMQIRLHSLVLATKVQINMLITQTGMTYRTQQSPQSALAEGSDRCRSACISVKSSANKNRCRSVSSSTKSGANNSGQDKQAHQQSLVHRMVQISLLIHTVWCEQWWCRSACSFAQSEVSIWYANLRWAN